MHHVACAAARPPQPNLQPNAPRSRPPKHCPSRTWCWAGAGRPRIAPRPPAASPPSCTPRARRPRSIQCAWSSIRKEARPRLGEPAPGVKGAAMLFVSFDRKRLGDALTLSSPHMHSPFCSDVVRQTARVGLPSQKKTTAPACLQTMQKDEHGEWSFR